MIQPPKDNPTPKLQRTATLTWKKGLVTSGGRADTPKDGLFKADNIIIHPEGSVSSRAPFAKAAIPDLPGDDFVGPIFSYWNKEEERFDLLTIVCGKLYLYEAGATDWTLVAQPNGSVDFSMGQLASYAQWGYLIAIADGVNQMAYFTIPGDGRTAGVARPGSEIASNPNMTIANGATTGDYRAYYLISYVNDWGETPASGGGAFTTAKKFANVVLADDMNPLGQWTTKVRVNISGVTQHGSNSRVRVYRVLTPDFISPSVIHYQLIKEFAVGQVPASFEDDGTIAGRLLSPQLENSTGGLVARYVTEIDGRLWAIGSKKEYQKLYYTGAAPVDSVYPQFFVGDGGYFYVAYGTSFEPVTIRRGRADDGQICNFVLCSGPNAVGRRFNILSLSTTYGNQSVHQFYPSEQKGDEGAYSTFGVLDYLNSILYPSPVGFKSSGIRATYTGDNITASIDQNIQDIVAAIPYKTLKNMYGTIYNGKAIWHIDNMTMLVFDARSNGAWARWTTPHKWFGSISVDQDRVALYAVMDREVLRYTDLADFKPRDKSGAEFPVILGSGKLTVAPDDGREWVRLLHVLFVFSEMEGPVRLRVQANSRRRLENYEGTLLLNQEMFGREDYQGNEPVSFSKKVEHKGEYGSDSPWSDGPFILRRQPTSGTVEVRVRINKDVNYLNWDITSLEGFIGLKLDAFVYEYVTIGVGLDFSTRYNEVRLKTVRG
ncbi:MAG: hypothetical protein FWD27_00700 [Coriobacteriia bacterium]|nr:hypothetical protein [Coriobacteriia bacterium]